MESILLYMSPQARRRLHRTMTQSELEDLAKEIALAVLIRSDADTLDIVRDAIFRGREDD